MAAALLEPVLTGALDMPAHVAGGLIDEAGPDIVAMHYNFGRQHKTVFRHLGKLSEDHRIP